MVGVAHQKPVLLLSVVLALVSAIHNVELVEWTSIARHLCLQSSLDVLPPLNLLLSLVNDSHHSIQVSQLLTTLPKHLRICPHLTAEQGDMGVWDPGNQTSSSVFPSTSLQMESTSSLPYSPQSRTNRLKSLLLHSENPCSSTLNRDRERERER